MPQPLEDYTVEATGKTWIQLEDNVNPPLGLKREHVASDSLAFLGAEDDITRAGVQQGLMDLGYLAEKDTAHSQETIQQALSHWRKDTRAYAANYALATSTGEILKITNTDLSLEAPLPVLSIQTGFDGDLRLRVMPKTGARTNLGARILQFRLKAFNRFDQDVNGLLTQEAKETLEKLHTHFSTLTEASELNLTLLNRLGNAAALTKHFSHKYKKKVFVTRHIANDTAVILQKAGQFTIIQKQRTNQRRGNNRTFKNYKKGAHVLHSRSTESGDSLDTIFESDINSLGLELLQLRLWQHGYYAGVLDADWGIVSQEALNSFHATFIAGNETNIRTFKHEDFIAQIEDGQVINLCFIFDELLGLADRTIQVISNEHINEITEEVFPQDDAANEWDTITEQAINSNQNALQATKSVDVQTFRYGQAKVSRRRKRNNFSRMGILGSITGWFRRLGNHIEAIALKIRDAIIGGLKSIRTFFRYAISKIKRVVRVVKIAIQRFYYWIAGKPFGSGDPKNGAFFMTQWSIDFDTINLISSDASSDLRSYHMDRIAFMNASLHFVVKVALTVLELLLKTTAGGLGLAYSIYKFILNWDDWRKDNPFQLYLEPAYQH